MKLKIKSEIEINHEDPLSSGALNLRDSGEILTQLISSLEEPSIIAIDAPWGHGKTTFLRMLRQHMINDDFQTLYFNAWENDFVNDALATLIGEIESGLNELSVTGGKKSKARRTVTQLKRIGSYLAKKSAPVAVRLLTANIVDIDEIYKQAVADISENVAREQIDNYEKAKRNFHNFKDKLSVFVSTIQENNNRPVVFFIDELDRCRPSFAIELLEKAKHLFSVPGFVFVIAIDKEQIGHSIRSVYGLGMDVDGYLRRFIDFDYRLPKLDNHEYAKHLFNMYEFTDYFDKRKARDKSYATDVIVDMFGELSKIFGMSLRVQEQCFSLLTIVLRTSPKNQEIHPHLLIYLLVLKIANPTLYSKYIKNVVGIHAMLEDLRQLEGGGKFLSTHNGAVLEAYLVSARENNPDMSTYLKNCKSILQNQSADNGAKLRADTICNVINGIISSRKQDLVSVFAKKIEISDRFLDDSISE